MENIEKFIGGMITMAVIVGLSTGAYYAFFTGADSGIVVTHNGAPVHDMQVNVYCANAPNHANITTNPVQSGTTDGTGSFTFGDVSLDACMGMNGYAYTFTYNGTGLIKFGPTHSVTQITV